MKMEYKTKMRNNLIKHLLTGSRDWSSKSFEQTFNSIWQLWNVLRRLRLLRSRINALFIRYPIAVSIYLIWLRIYVRPMPKDHGHFCVQCLAIIVEASWHGVAIDECDDDCTTLWALERRRKQQPQNHFHIGFVDLFVRFGTVHERSTQRICFIIYRQRDMGWHAMCVDIHISKSNLFGFWSVAGLVLGYAPRPTRYAGFVFWGWFECGEREARSAYADVSIYMIEYAVHTQDNHNSPTYNLGCHAEPHKSMRPQI